ncbi:MAG: alpha/beta hydrolase [Chloroflexi bacterium]|nr:alpha/beta hydrolase [Chloroflexota bacterium]
MTTPSSKGCLRKAIIGLALLVLLGGVAGGLWYINYDRGSAQPTADALAALEPDADLAVRRTPWIVFEPQDTAPTTGLIFYPGGRVDPRAYAVPLRGVAEQGYLVVIVPMPLDLAYLGSDRAANVMEAYPDIDRWVMSGHSLGAGAAAYFTAENMDQVDGVVLWAGYPPRDNPLLDFDGPISVITASNDRLVRPRPIEWASQRLPADTFYLTIDGGNHAGFANYAVEPGGRDGIATISVEAQQMQLIEATLSLLDQVTLQTVQAD